MWGWTYRSVRPRCASSTSLAKLSTKARQNRILAVDAVPEFRAIEQNHEDRDERRHIENGRQEHPKIAGTHICERRIHHPRRVAPAIHVGDAARDVEHRQRDDKALFAKSESDSAMLTSAKIIAVS
jgi:hypothetical protein